MELNDLIADVTGRLAPGRRAVLERLVEEYGASETFRFTLALAAAGTRRERQLLRLLLGQLDETNDAPEPAPE